MGLSQDDVPQEIEEAIMHSHGEQEGQEWLNHALDQLSQLETDWDFNTVEVLGGEGSLLVKVEPSAIDEEGSVVKIPVDVQSGCDEIAALKIWEDCSVPLVINEDLETGVFMMDYVTSTDKAVSPFQAFVLADVLHEPAVNFDYRFPALKDNLNQRIIEAYRRHEVAESTDLWLAVKTVETLLATQDHEALLHGDYQNTNIIYSESGPIIIDPQPCVGDSMFDIALWLANTRNFEDIAVVLQLAGPAGARLIPWMWSLSVLNEGHSAILTPAAGAYREQATNWLDKQT